MKTRSFGYDAAGRMGIVTAPVLADSHASYTPGISQRSSGTTTFNLADRLGSFTKQTGAAQTVTGAKTFDAFGNVESSSGTPVGPFGFAGGAGYQADADSGLMLLGHRYYDSSTGRFLTRDHAEDGRNWYVYCGSNPLRWVDPTGLVDHRSGARESTRGKHERGKRRKQEDQGGEKADPGRFPEKVKGEPSQPPKDSPGYLRPGPKRNPAVPIGILIGIGIWEGVKWIAAGLAIPETGGLSLAGAGALP